ncbi:biosynthetic-type acetolactate synthase large subunit [Sediminispirochaeta bajacaliforniensis]|uniref:biosynthetic-type acetolactate synthase large subunit n=1 Tax=Sediminispirochaeta bajacaliforniensis TaxID=148 RepID=UPI00037D623B
MILKGARILVESLLLEGVDTIFAYTGGKVISIFDQLQEFEDRVRLILPRHEQGGTHAADGYARSTGRPGVVIVTSGPGATNTVTGIATAYMDSVPMVVITGQVNLDQIGSDAFQEADVVGITMPITKANFLVRDASEIAYTVKKAFHLATTGRPGPVVIDIPGDVQAQDVSFDYPDTIELRGYKPNMNGHPKQIKSVIGMLKQSRKPLIIAGGGVNLSGATEMVNRLADEKGIPVVCTLMGHGVMPKRSELLLGPIGMHGTLYGNYAVQHADLILALGVRFSDRIVGDGAGFAPKAKLVHVDIDPAEIGKSIKADLPIVGTIQSVLGDLNKADIPVDSEQWIRELVEYRSAHPLVAEDPKNPGGLAPQRLIQLAGEIFPKETIVVTDVGQNQMWAALFFGFSRGRSFLTSGGLGTMGFGLPAAIGAAVGNPDKPVLMISGDGGFQMNLQELATIRRYRLPVKMLVIDNGYLGMVRQWQELLFEKRYAGTVMDDNPDFAALAEVFGIHGRTLRDAKDAQDVLRELAECEGPMLLHAHVSPSANVLPMVPAGKPLEQVVEKI